MTFQAKHKIKSPNAIEQQLVDEFASALKEKMQDFYKTMTPQNQRDTHTFVGWSNTIARRVIRKALKHE